MGGLASCVRALVELGAGLDPGLGGDLITLNCVGSLLL